MIDIDLIHHAFETKTCSPACLEAIGQTLALLDQGKLRVASYENGEWICHTWIKKAILLSFKFYPAHVINAGIETGFDKIPLKTKGWSESKFLEAGFRMVPGSIVRHSAYIGKNVVLMPSFVNVGAYVGEGTMIDTWSTIGSCAQIGRHVHISGGVGIGGVLEPIQDNPVIIEDHAFIGARSEVAEGVIVGEGAVISMGVFLGASTKIINRQTGEITYGKVPPYSVVVPGTHGGKDNQPSLACAVIVKQVDEKTRAKVGINALLREATSRDGQISV